MAGHSTWRVTGSRITGAVPEEVRAGQSRPPDLAYTGQMRSSGQFRHAASSSFTASVTLEIRSAASTAVIQVSSCSPCRPVRILANSVTWPARVAMLSARWARLEVPGDHQDVRVAGQESGQAHLGRRSVQGRGRRQHGGVLGHLGYTEETPSRGEVHPRPGCAPGTSRGGARPSGRGGCRRSGDALVALGEECDRAGGTGDDLAEGGGDDLPTGELIPSLAAEHQARDKQTCQRERRWA